MNDDELRFQVELTKLYGKGMSYQLEVHRKGKMEIRNKEYYRKVSGAVSEKGYIRFSSLRHAFSILSSLDRSITFKADKNMKMSYPAEIPSRYFMIPDGTPTKKLEARFSKDYDINNENPEERKRMLIRLRTAIWHEVMEVALIAVNTLVFKNPEDTTKLGLRYAFADEYVRSQENTGSFFPWTGDKIPSLAKKQGLSLPRGPIKELKITCAARLTGTIKDYKGRVVEKLDIPPGRTFVWGPKAEPGEYWLDAVFGSQIIKNQKLELLPAKPLSLKASFKRDQFGDLYMIIEYENWPRNKGMGIRIVGEKSKREPYKKPTDNNKGRIIWGKSYDFKREDYIVEPYCDGDPFLHVWAESEKLVKPVSLDFGSRWMVEPRDRCAYVRILYKDWHGYFVCKIKDTLGKTVETFKKTDRAGYIDWGRGSSVKPGKYIIEATIDKGIFETETAVISE